MRGLSRIIFVFICFFQSMAGPAQVNKYTVANAHSHNDYLNSKPFLLAFKNGFGSIEADVFPVDGVLYVAHTKKEIRPQQTLQHLYLKPLLHEFASNGGRKLSLLIDIKENYAVTLPLLIKELEPLKNYLAVLEKPGYLTIIISGNRPSPAEYKNYPGYIFFDSDLKSPHTNDEWKRVALVSLPFNKLTQWKGEKGLKNKDRKIIRHIIDSVHSLGKPIRFWAAPDTRISWKWQMKLQTDLVGTDKIEELGDFLKKDNNN